MVRQPFQADVQRSVRLESLTYRETLNLSVTTGLTRQRPRIRLRLLDTQMFQISLSAAFAAVCIGDFFPSRRCLFEHCLRRHIFCTADITASSSAATYSSTPATRGNNERTLPLRRVHQTLTQFGALVRCELRVKPCSDETPTSAPASRPRRPRELRADSRCASQPTG